MLYSRNNTRIVNLINEFLFLGENLGYFNISEDNNLKNKIVRLKVLDDSKVKDLNIKNENGKYILKYNPEILDMDLDSLRYILYRKLSSFLNCLNAQEIKANSKRIKSGIKFINEVVSKEVALNLLSYLKRNSRKDVKLAMLPYTNILFKTNYDDEEIGQEIVTNFAKSLNGNEFLNDNAAMFDLITLSFKNDFLKSLVDRHKINEESFSKILKQLYYIGIVYDTKTDVYGGKIVSSEECELTRKAILKVSDLRYKDNNKTLTK